MTEPAIDIQPGGSRAWPRLDATEKYATGSQKVRPLRRHPRTQTRLRAVLYARDTFIPTTIRDISVGGIGLEGAYGVFPGDRVSIALISGEKRTGIVRWWLNGCCGVQFDTPLAATDPWLARAERAGARSTAGAAPDAPT
jgi:hypothetical protein